MKYFFTILSAFISMVAYTQVTHQEMEALFWNKNDPYANLTEIEPEFKDNQLVLLAKNSVFDYDNQDGKYITKEGTRIRVAILDKQSLATYSSFQYITNYVVKKGLDTTDKNGRAFFGAKIIKPNGKEIKIDLANAVPIEDEEDVEGSKKIALPNLEIGDIIDYYYAFYEEFDTEFDAWAFETIALQTGTTDPIQNLSVTIIANNDFNVHFKGYNGAPKATETALSTIRTKYEFQEKNIDKIAFNDEPWVNFTAEYPHIKFKIYHGTPKSLETPWSESFTTQIKEINQTISKEELANYLKFFLENNDYSSGISEKSAEQLEKNKFTQNKYKMLYSYFTSLRLVTNFGNINSTNIDNIAMLTAFLKQFNYEFDVLAVPHHEGYTLNNIVTTDDINYLVRVYNLGKKKKTVYLTPFFFGNRMGDLPAYYQGQEALVYKNGEVSTTTVKQLTAQDNLSTSKITVTIPENFEQTKVKVIRTIAGERKIVEADTWLSYKDYFLAEDTNVHFSAPTIKGEKQYLFQELVEIFEDIYKVIEDESYDQAVLQTAQESVDYEFSIDSKDSFKYRLISNGIDPISSKLKFSFVFTTNKYVKKAGKKYLFPAGQLIGRQVELTKEQITHREKDIFIGYPRNFENNIRINIPEGYTVKGIDELNYNIDNEIGAFIAKATVKDDAIKIHVQKIYKQKNIAKEDWQKMVNFLEAAYEFTQKKILFIPQETTKNE